ncbi:MAG: pseudouridine synthase [Nitrosomonadales bacterium]
MAELIRISKLLSERNICSRREADDFIQKGYVYLDGKKVTELGTKAYPDQHLELRKEGAVLQKNKKTILLHKPISYVSHADDDKKYKSALSLITPENFFGEENLKQSFFKIAPAGRLDIDSTGLLVLTEDGVVAKQIIQEDSDIEKEYLVRVKGQLSDHGLKLLNFGLALDGKPLKKANVRWLNEDQLIFVLKEGKKRQIRRMCELVGLKVTGLKRVRIGRVKLGQLPVGKWRFLLPSEKF